MPNLGAFRVLYKKKKNLLSQGRREFMRISRNLPRCPTGAMTETESESRNNNRGEQRKEREDGE